MMADVQLQIYPNNNDDDYYHYDHYHDHDDHHEHEQFQPSSSSRPPEIFSFSSSDASLEMLHWHHHEHEQVQPRSSSCPPEIALFSPASSSSAPKSPPKIVKANHYSILFQNDVTKLRPQIRDVSTRCTESDDNTLLHIAASVGQLDFIDSILQQTPHLHNNVRNSKRDLPLHAAARGCQLDAVKQLVSKAEGDNRTSMLKAKNEDDNTALHIALQNYQEDMAFFLFKECPDTCYYLNSQEFSPLYLAIKAEFWDLVTAMLSDPHHSTDEAHQDCFTKGKSVVHAAISAGKQVILEKMISKYGFELMYEIRDEMGRTPLSYAAYTGFHDWVNYMINTGELQNQAYVVDKNGCFPIHWACGGGTMGVVKLFFDSFPENTRWLLNNKGQNILHVAAANGKAEVVKYILKQPKLEGMINMKDDDGNTAFHLGCKEKHPRVVYLFTLDDRVRLNAQNKHGLTALDIAEEYADDVPSFEERLIWLFLRCAGVSKAPQLHYFNNGGINDAETNDNTSPISPNVILQRNQLNKKHLQILMKPKNKERINTLLVVSILVATVTFTSGFTIPGGYKNNSPGEGMATLAHKVAFQLFVITNTISLHSSVLASVTLIWAHLDDLRLTTLSLRLALPLLGTALAMMSVAFTVGLYVVLNDVILWLSIAVLVMEGVFLVTLLIFFIPLYSPTTCISNSFLCYVFRVPFTLMLLACEKGKGRGTLCY